MMPVCGFELVFARLLKGTIYLIVYSPGWVQVACRAQYVQAFSFTATFDTYRESLSVMESYMV